MSILSHITRRGAQRRLDELRALALRPEAAQTWVHDFLLKRGRDTAFGRDHDFASIRTYEDWQQAVPLRDYTAHAAYWDRARAGESDVAWPGRIRYWAISSGTTAGEKYLPVSMDTIRGNRNGGWDCMVPYLAHGSEDLLAGKLVFLGGSTSLRQEGDIWIGDNTGIMTLHIPKLLRRWHSPGGAIAGLSDWEEKIQRAAEIAVEQDVRMISGVPSWMVLFSERVLALARNGGPVRTLKDVWPHLCLYVHGGMSFEPYRDRFCDLAGPDIWCTDTYSASEGGTLAVQDRRWEPGMLPLVDQGVFFEFVPWSEIDAPSPRRYRIHEVEPNVDYAVVLSTDSGIYGYLVGDVVRFLSTDPLRLLFSGRLAHTLNAFGEHVSGGELDRAISAAAHATGAAVLEYAVAPRYPDEASAVGAHVYYVEYERSPSDPARFAAVIDETIAEGNEDYGAHRARSFGLGPPVVEAVPRGAFYAWMKARGKLGGQNKMPRVLGPALAESFTTHLAALDAV